MIFSGTQFLHSCRQQQRFRFRAAGSPAFFLCVFITAAACLLKPYPAAAQTGSVGAQKNPQTAAAAPPSTVAVSSKKPLTFWSNMEHGLLADSIISQMTDEELLAQILMFGWAGTEPSSLLMNWISQRSLGSVKVYGWSTDDVVNVAKSVSMVQKASLNNRFEIPLYVATDQEGGWIRHIKGQTSDTPGNLAIGASGYPTDAWHTGYYIARELRALGINMNFAPTIDLYSNHDSSVIGPRSFGEDAHTAGILGVSFSDGSMEAGVIPTAKHFPGHGDTSADSHGALPEIRISRETLSSRELVPFKYVINWKIPAIMSGHLSFPDIMPNGEPASLSRFFLRTILRDEMGFEGLIITDDMMMNGATMYAGGLSTAVRMAIDAGNDIIISSSTPQLGDSLWTNNIDLMKKSSGFRTAVMQAARRVIYTKLQYFKSEHPVPLYPDLSAINSSVPDPDGVQFFLEQACRSITAAKKGLFPYPPVSAGNKEKILLAGSFQSFFDEGLKRYPGAGQYRFSYLMNNGEARLHEQKLTAEAQKYDTIIVSCASAEGARMIRALAGTKKRIIVISIMSPTNVFGLTEADTVLYAYSYSPYSFAAVFGALAGEFEPQGTLPLKEPL